MGQTLAIPWTLEQIRAEQARRAAAKLRGPTDEAQLADYLLRTFGVRLPSVRVCHGHCSPWEAFCHAYFARSPVSVWKASRGLGGKSFTLSLLALVEAVTLGADVNVLGGSGAQSKRVLEAMMKLWETPGAPHDALASPPGQQITRFKRGNAIRALMASQASVRGPHPQRLRMDEIDEMDLAILDAAMGQPMSSGGVLSQVVLSSTHQYPDGTMSRILRRAKENHFPTFEWCWKETCEPHGWLSLEEINRKRAVVTANMWSTEFDLQEPSAEGRAIVTEAVDRMFDPGLGEVTVEMGQYYEFEPPVAGASYASAADWARKTDFTDIGTVRTDKLPRRLVAYERLQRVPWPQMVGRFDARLRRYPGPGCHDGTGLGDVVASLLTESAEPFLMVGRPRQDLLSNYIKSVEDGEWLVPRLSSAYNEHKFATYDDVYGSGHLPDSISMMALAHRAAGGSGAGMGFLTYATDVVKAAKAAPPAEEENPWLAGYRQ